MELEASKLSNNGQEDKMEIDGAVMKNEGALPALLWNDLHDIVSEKRFRRLLYYYL